MIYADYSGSAAAEINLYSPFLSRRENNLLKSSMKYTCPILLILLLGFGCQSKKQAEKARKISGISTETSDIVFADSAAKQTRGVQVGEAWIVPRHMILENISKLRNTRLFTQQLQGTSLAETLDGKGPFTLFLPNDTAFQKLGNLKLQQLLTEQTDEQRTELIRHHLVSGKIMAADLEDKAVLKAADGHELQVQNNGRTIKIDGAAIIVKDGVSNNGVVHLIDQVLLPERD